MTQPDDDELDFQSVFETFSHLRLCHGPRLAG